jgi:uncharacterized membrane protein YhaH (DUF805 family)
MTTPPAIEAPESEDALAVVKALTEVSTVLLALTFVGGWSYLAAYYRTFGLNPLELDFEFPVVSTLAIYVLYKSLWPLITLAATVGVLALMTRRVRRLNRGWIAAALIVLLCVVIVAGASRGRHLADQDMLVTSSSLPNVAFAAKNAVGQLPCAEVGTFGSSDCRLLLETKSGYYFFQPIPDAGKGNLNLFILPAAQVQAIHVVRGLDRNTR